MVDKSNTYEENCKHKRINNNTEQKEVVNAIDETQIDSSDNEYFEATKDKEENLNSDSQNISMRQSIKFKNDSNDNKELKDPHSFSLSFRDKKLSKLTKSVLESNYSTRITESDGHFTDSYINCSKTPNIVLKRPQQADLDLLVNPSKGFVVDQDSQFRLVNNYSNIYLEENNNNLQKAAISNFKLVSNLDTKVENDFKIESNDANNSKKASDSALCYQNSFKEHLAEETQNVVERKMKILFTIYISQGLIQQVTGESKEKYPNPIVIKELITVMSTENFIPIIKRFISIVNCHLEVYNLRLLNLIEAVNIINGENTKLEDQTVYLPKYMKTSGKPDYDLPGFDLKTPIDLFKVDKFALGFEPQCLTCTKGKSSKLKSEVKPVIDYISETDSGDESSSTGNSFRHNIIHLNNQAQYSMIGNETLIKEEKSTLNENAINQNMASRITEVSSTQKKQKGCCDFCIVF